MADLLVIGLGNPGAKFEHTRHNVGSDTVERFAARHGGALATERRARARVASIRIGVDRVVVAVPTTYMNESGQAALPLVRQYLEGEDEPLSRLVVVHDELDLPPGTVRLKAGGGTAGHNGLRSIGAHLHGLGFFRIRIGVGKPPGPGTGVDYVLQRLNGPERKVLEEACDRAADAIDRIVEDGFERAMNAVNTR